VEEIMGENEEFVDLGPAIVTDAMNSSLARACSEATE